MSVKKCDQMCPSWKLFSYTHCYDICFLYYGCEDVFQDLHITFCRTLSNGIFFSCMDANIMFAKNAFLRKLLVAYITRIWFFICMNANMFVKTSIPCKTLFAYLTVIGFSPVWVRKRDIRLLACRILYNDMFFSCMYGEMCDQKSLSRKPFVAHITMTWFVLCGSEDVL